jgi:hypothetical protein
MEAVGEHQEVPNEEAAVETIGALEDRSGDRRPAVGEGRKEERRKRGRIDRNINCPD